MAKIGDLEQELKGRAYESEQLRSELHKLDADLNRVNLVVNQAPQQQHEQSRAPGASTSMTASLRTSLVPALPDLRADRHQAKELQRLEAKLDVLAGSLSLTVEQLAAGGIAANSKAADTSSMPAMLWLAAGYMINGIKGSQGPSTKRVNRIQGVRFWDFRAWAWVCGLSRKAR